MDIKTHNQKRYCVSCQKEQEHLLIYLDKYLKSGRCLTCNQEFNNKDILFDVYVHDTPERFQKKSLRFYHDFMSPRHSKSSKKISRFRMIMDLFKVPFKEFYNVNQIWGNYDYDSRNTVSIRQTKLFINITKYWGRKFRQLQKRLTS
jgi:hypothetical protein